MSTTEEKEEDIIASIQNELSSSEEDALLDELSQSPELKSFHAEMKTLHKELANAPRISMPLHKTREIMAVTTGKKKKKGNLIYTFVAAAAVIFAITYIFKTTPENTLAPAQPKMVAKTDRLEQAYDWLQANQTDLGNWTSNNPNAENRYETGLTGLSLLALIDKKTKTDDDFQTINKAVLWLKNNQDENGRFGPEINNHLYNHGIATYALLKAEPILKDEQKANIQKALHFIVENQSSEGGWGYSNEPDSINTSITVWQLQSLLLAQKISIADNSSTIQKGFEWIKSVSDKNGIPGYRRANDFPYGKQALTAISGLFFQHHKQLGIDPIEARLNFQSELENFTKRAPEDINYYQCYFMAENLKHFNVKNQAEFENQIRLTLKLKQTQDGQAPGTWNPDDLWGSSGGRTYSTTMALMALNCLD